MSVLNELIIDSNDIAFHPVMGNSYQLNKTGKIILNELQAKRTNEEIISKLSDLYDIPSEALYIDVYDFISKLKLYGLA